MCWDSMERKKTHVRAALALLAASLIYPAPPLASAGQGSQPLPIVDISWAEPSAVKLSWTMQPGRIFSIEYSDDLTTWMPIGLGNVATFIDEVEGLTKGYYRICSNAPPELEPVADRVVRPGETLEFTVSGSDPDGDDLLLGASNLPEGAVFDPDSGLFRWTPTRDQEGTYAGVRFSVSDDGIPQLADYQDMTIIVGGITPEIVVTYPQEGQQVEAGTVDTIAWTSHGNVGDVVHIDFSPDGGETWYVIRENVPNAGYYNWIVPDSSEFPELPSDDCWIAVWSQDESTYGLTSGAFSIYETVYVIWSIYLVAGDGRYLGDCTTDPYVWDSIWNELGPYGSTTSWTSIWNPVGIYGSDYSDLSPWDPYALDPPYIFINDDYVASLTTNYLIWDAIYPEDFFTWVEWIGY